MNGRSSQESATRYALVVPTILKPPQMHIVYVVVVRGLKALRTRGSVQTSAGLVSARQFEAVPWCSRCVSSKVSGTGP